MNGDGRIVRRDTPAKALAWKCLTCTRLSVRMEYQDPPAACDHNHQHTRLERVALRDTRLRA